MKRVLKMDQKENTFETIIIGAGIAGLACARKLHENGKDFLVISEDIGGRCGKYSQNGVSYGAYFMMGNYHNVKQFLRIKRKIPLSTIYFHNKNHSYTFFSKKLFTHPVQLIKLIFLLLKFSGRYASHKKKCESVSQVQAIKSDPFIFKLCQQNAKDFSMEYGIKELIEDYVSKMFYACAFFPIYEANASELVWVASTIINPPYEFVFLKDRMIKDFKNNIIIDTVTGITKKEDFYFVRTNGKVFITKNVVVATPPPISRRLLHLKKIKGPSKVHIFHLYGKLLDPSKYGDMNLFSEDSPTILIGRQMDGTFLFYSKTKNPKFEEYFQRYKIINHKFWNPAYSFKGNVLWKCKQDVNLYLIGDHNLANLEDAYTTGLYAANQIIGSK